MIPIKATTKMGPRFQILPQNLLPQPTKLQTRPFSSSALAAKTICRTLKIKCSKEKENLTDETLAAKLGLEIEKLNTDKVQREEALKKSRELLFAEICGFVGLKSDDLKKKWWRMSEEERCGLAKVFVGEWSEQFHPLSAKSVKEMVEEYLGGDDEFSDSDSSANLFPDLRKLLGFP